MGEMEATSHYVSAVHQGNWSVCDSYCQDWEGERGGGDGDGRERRTEGGGGGDKEEEDEEERKEGSSLFFFCPQLTG